MTTFSDILDQDLLRDLAGDRYYQRGVDYFERGLVRSLAEYDGRIVADVSGTESYQVQLWLENGDLMSRCSCPLGVDDLFCKHCVAVGLAWIAEPPPYRPASETPARKGTTMDDVHEYLTQQSHYALVQLILNQSMEDERWRERLLMKAAAQQVGGPDINTFRRSLRNVIIPSGFIDYYATSEYADAVQAVISGLDDLLEQGYASAVMELCEEAIALLDEAFNSIDDSSGHVGLVADDLQHLHYQACEVARPDVRDLAARLLRMEVESGYGFFYKASDRYADILGDEGRAAYGQLIDAELQRYQAMDDDRRTEYRRSELCRMKEAWVSTSGTIDDVVNVMAQDLSAPHRYLQIARRYQEAGRIEEAIAWAEDGLKAFAESYRTGNLGEFLIAEYEKQWRFDDAIAVIWQDFEQSPSLVIYKKLKAQAEKANAWPEWRERAISHARHVIDEAESGDRSRAFPHIRSSYTERTLLVEIFMWEGDADQAWEEAQQRQCPQKLWIRLAEAREADHPEDALPIHQRNVEPLINQTNNQAYLEAIGLLLKMQTLMAKLDQRAEFAAFVSTLRRTYQRKRNFIKFLNQKGL